MATQPNSVIKKSVNNLNYLCGQQVSLKFGKDDKQLFCFCQGVSIGQFIITQIPLAPDIEQKLAPGNSVVIRFIESGMVCGFETKIRLAITIPFRLIFFNYPDSLELLNLRSSKRVPIYINATIRMDGTSFEGSIRNLSAGGCFFAAKQSEKVPLSKLTMQSSLSILFNLLNNDAAVSLHCRPAKVESDKNEVRLGLVFENNPPETISRISSFVEYVSQLLGEQELSFGNHPPL